MPRPKIYTGETVQEHIRQHDRERKQLQRQIWKESGLCIGCGNARDTHRLKCSKCYGRSLTNSNQARAKRKQNGICVECGKVPALAGYVVCIQCRDLQRERSQNNRTKRLLGGKEWRDRLTKEVLAAYGNKCKCCGESEPLFLEIDHIHGNGTQHRKTVRGGVAFYRWLQKNNYPQDDFQILCRNCNYGRYRNGGICPHNK